MTIWRWSGDLVAAAAPAGEVAAQADDLTPIAPSDQQALPRVGFVIPCKNEEANLARCIAAIRAQQYPVAQIVVVDNGSTDASVSIAAELADDVLVVPDGRLGRLRNLGAAALRDVDVVAFVDADIELAPGWLAAGVRELRSAALVGNRTLAPADAGWVARRWASVEACTVHDASLLWSGALAARRTAFEDVGGFDETLLTGEDADLSARLRSSGCGIRFVGDMTAVHHGNPASLGRFLRWERWHTSDPDWFSWMSGRSKALVVGSGLWLGVGGIATGTAIAGRSAGPAWSWAAASLLLVPALGYLGGRDLRHCGQDGVLISVWALNRVARLAERAIRTDAPTRVPMTRTHR